MNLQTYKAAMLRSADLIEDTPRPRSSTSKTARAIMAHGTTEGPLFIGPYALPMPMVAKIQAEVARFYNIPAIEMVSARRAREVTRPRQVAMYLAKRLTPKSLPDIGRLFGGRDHTTVIHGIRAVEQRRAKNIEFDKDVRSLEDALLSTNNPQATLRVEQAQTAGA